MADGTGIEWCDATFNPWLGCTKVSRACDFCYAERWGNRFGVEWGNHPRRRTSRSYWAQPLRWDREAQAFGIRKRVFCASLADWLDNQVDPAWRSDLGALIAHTPHLDWLLLTKRPQNYEALAPWPVNDPPPNVSLGTTTENQEEADRRIPEILRWPAKWHFISAEPLLGPIDLTHIEIVARKPRSNRAGIHVDALTGKHFESGVIAPNFRLDWVIAGGESIGSDRPLDPAWVRSLRDQCQAAGVAFFFKQWGRLFPAEFIRTGPDGEVWRRCHDGEERWSVEESSLGLAEGAVPVKYEDVGKRAAGRLLDGREHNEVPA